MYLTTENAEKFLGTVLMQRTLGANIRQIQVIQFPDGRYAYKILKNGVCIPVPTPTDKFNAVSIVW